MYHPDYVGLCKSRATNPELPLDMLDGIRREFDKALAGGIFGTTYVLEKLEALIVHVSWVHGEAAREFAADCEPEEEPPIKSTRNGFSVFPPRKKR